MPRIALSFLIFMIAFPLHALAADNGVVKETFGDREMLVYVPQHLQPTGQRALVIVLHGGFGNAGNIVGSRAESGLNMNKVAEQGGFIVAYLNGTPVMRFFSANQFGWNAGGGCCGVPAASNIDDVAYITAAANHLAEEYGIDRKLIFGMGHSNGAMMSQRLICEANVLAAIVAISGPLNMRLESCPAARGKRILAIHGDKDENVPLTGGVGPKGFSGVDFNSEAKSEAAMAASGAAYDLDIVKGADHRLDHLDDAVKAAEGQSIAEKAARYFGLIAAK